jgi:hypothetical protein
MRRVVRLQNAFLVCAVLLLAATGLQATPVTPGCSEFTSSPGPSFSCLDAGSLGDGLDFVEYTITAAPGHTIDSVSLGGDELAAYVSPANDPISILTTADSIYDFKATNSVTIESLVYSPTSGKISLPGLNYYVDPPAPAPEPGFYGVLAAGLAGIFMFAKRRQKTV